jgi:cyclopropane fatty-acyl-phospholipid synthase-like methyltransferase
MIGRFIAGQLRKPKGFVGGLIGNGLARSNAHEARWTVSLLSIRPESRVLEVGFGPGVAVQYAAEQASRGLVAGVDFSEAMVQLARQRNRSAVAGYRDVRVETYPRSDEFAGACILGVK